mgnify:CR=1 FL=1
MRKLEHISQRLKDLVPIVAILVGMAYFGYHLLHGNNGLMALEDLDQEYQVLKEKADKTAEKRLALEIKVSGMRPDNIDPDLMDERARKILGFSKRDEVIILK